MGCHENITAEKFPKQGEWFRRRTRVCFHYDTENWLEGLIVRADMEAPFLTIILLADGRLVMSTECQHSPFKPEEDKSSMGLAELKALTVGDNVPAESAQETLDCVDSEGR